LGGAAAPAAAAVLPKLEKIVKELPVESEPEPEFLGGYDDGDNIATVASAAVIFTVLSEPFNLVDWNFSRRK
jgi:hypothetical protein